MAAVSKGTTLKVPELLATTCVFIKEKFKSGLRKLPCGSREEHLGEVFRTDAKCADGRVVLGGWKLGQSSDLREASWFALELGPEEVPWLFRGQSSSWASTSAELLASVVALQIFDVGSNHPAGLHMSFIAEEERTTKLRNHFPLRDSAQSFLR